MKGVREYHPETYQVANTSGTANTEVIDQPGTDKQIVIHTLISDTAGWLTYGEATMEAGGKVCRMDNQGGQLLNITLPPNKSLWKDCAGNQTITYYIK
tara:strand:+ start:141 stop:434 length:294 start_codon:yes stop_codon:yes gene_type:complete